MASSSSLAVGAIDFGTTYSGWGCSFLYEFSSDPTKATVKQWKSGTITTEKAPSCVLIGPDKKFVAFGYDAETKYMDLTKKKAHRNHYYFKRFKMMLNKKLGDRLDLNITIEDALGKSLPAVDVFAMVIKYLVDDMIQTADNWHAGSLSKDDVMWVLTVPAIWTDAAKQFMRTAGKKAGIDDNKLMIALEPEAASIYCRHLSVEKTVDQTKASVAQFKAGTRYMILDAGGGTIDITVHEVTDNGQVKEVQSASGGGWGGILVDKAFEDFIIDLVTPDIYQKFKLVETEDWLDMWRDFELKKRSVVPDSIALIVWKIPASLKEMFTDSTKTTLEEAIANSRYANLIEVDRDKLKFEANCFRQLFDNSIKKTVDHVKGVLRNVQVKAILMVGGFSESPMLQHAIKEKFKRNGVDVIIPLGASSTILRGAIIYGHSPQSITERVLQYTYGVKTSLPFEEGVHPERHRIENDHGIRCDHMFSKHVEKNQTVTVGEPQVERKYIPAFKNQRFLSIRLYASTLKNPTYTDEGCVYIGKLRIEVKEPNEDLKRNTLVSLTFSGTEIEVKARDELTGTKYSTKLDFLG